jgi:mRNA-degrading endonuclease toxin of MazEF toxin-antitoxin module
MADRGEIYLVDLEPNVGREQRGRRPVMVVSSSDFARVSPPLICPITQGGLAARFEGFAVILAGAGLKTTGAVLCNQVRALDLKARKARRIERAPDFIIDDVLTTLQDFFE